MSCQHSNSVRCHAKTINPDHGEIEVSQGTFGHLRRAAEAVRMQTGPYTPVRVNREVADDAKVHSAVLGLQATQSHSHVCLLWRAAVLTQASGPSH